MDQGRPPRIPGIGLVRLRSHGGNPDPEGKPVKASVIHECGKWCACVGYKVELPPLVPKARLLVLGS